MKNKEFSLIMIISILFVAFYNFTFFTNVASVYNIRENFIYFISMVVILFSFSVFFFTLFSSRYTTKPILIFVILVSSIAAYFMDNYGVIIDNTMLTNVLQTNTSETADLLSIKLFLYIIFLGIIPSIFIYKFKIIYPNFKTQFFSKLKILSIFLLIILATMLSFSKFYTSFFREHKPLRYTINPFYWLYSVGDFSTKSLKSTNIRFVKLGEDAKVVETSLEDKNDDKKELIILVIGEAARSDHFSLNGYERDTNPLLSKENIINFPNFTSCGTTTAVSVPCMFSALRHDNFDKDKAKNQDNALDILSRAGVRILWRDNNSDSKDVATRMEYENFKTNQNNKVYDNQECRDIGMLDGLDKFIDKNKNKDILIVLHQMGNHGPAYFKRYPKEFEKFTPVCNSNDLQECDQQSIINAYDNAILYTDYFLSEVIKFSKKYSSTHENAVIYMSDHGESLGENNIYLHGLPYAIAPQAQKHVPAFIWLGDGFFDVDSKKLKEKAKNGEFSQDYLFHTLLSIFEVQSEIYDKNLDILDGTKK
ncbi:MAG: phosphoethanolamine--lipid A transferase [Campylobacter sputorum]|uniref:phosphoethanolamine transferase n=1 Tax=Campylobacter sputorum TaxID=206 RepID=UPI000B77676A|nr:phosphoethanolamine--lipid A transferase [Campylobacter sputorum]ASM38627.1 phosphoethanolamine transferase [Campylobacter sputorum bv. paraureolyticus LMG 11764]MDY6120853.1 phosphoethanolamine--lipid A transferase [Campylobacter sputorum]